MSSFKIPKYPSAMSTTIQCLFYSYYGYNKTTHISVSSSFEISPSSSATILSKSLKINGRNDKIINSKALVPYMVKKHSSGYKKKPLWRNFLFKSKKFRSILLLNVITVIYASDITVIKEVEAFTDPAYFSAVRFGISSIPFLPFIFRARNDVQTRNSGLELGLYLSLAYLCEALGLLTADAGRASFISLFTVIVISLLESMLGETVPARTWFGILMSVIGISMLECSGSNPNIGDLFNFLGAIFFGIHTLRTEHISRTTKKENFLALLGYEVGVIAVMSTIWCFTGANFDGSDGTLWTWDWIYGFPWIPALYTGIFSTGLCLWAEIAAMRDVSALETAVIYGLEPLWGAGFAWFLLGERWGVSGWIGATLILGGSLTVQMFGASTDESRESMKREKEDENTMANNEKVQKRLSTSPVMVRSRDK